MASVEAPYEPKADAYLRDQWMGTFGAHNRAAPAFEELLRVYRSPGRYYHTIEHGHEVAGAALALSADLTNEDTELVALAAWAHDAYYQPGASDNEERSADIAASIGESFSYSSERIAMLRDLVLVSTHQTVTSRPLEMILCDADLASLAKPWTGYMDDVQNIRAEFNVEDDRTWQDVRELTLDFFEGREPLYYLDAATSRWHRPAHKNFVRERSSFSA